LAKYVLARFQTIPPNPRENDNYAPYNKLLYDLFPADTPFTVAPQTYPIPDSRESLDFLIEYQILLEDDPVFVLEIKSTARFGFASAREEADQRMRKRLRDLTGVCPLPKLRAVSVFGTKLCFYEATSTQSAVIVTPPPITQNPQMMLDTAPKDRWDCDILEEEGSTRFKGIIEQIKQECMALGGHVCSWNSL
jgi:hypothetical protein